MNQNTIVRPITRGIRLSVTFALLVLLAGLLAITQRARAASYEVTNTDNSGAGSLRWAIDEANSNPGPDTITFDPATDGSPIVLSGSSGEDANAGGDLDILDGGDLTIQGNGVANTIIDGDGKDRVFHICPGGGCTNKVTLIGMTIRNGNAGYGGGIANAGGTLTVDSCKVSANTATDRGGGIHNDNGATLKIQNGSTIGGAAAGNKATWWGGGIFNAINGTTTVEDSSISNNTATGGGGILSEPNSTTTVVGSTVSANKANTDGGGIFNFGTLNVQNGSTIGGAGAGNTASDNGGGIGTGDNSTTTVDGSSVSGNTAGVDGGGIANAGTLNVQNGSTIGGAGAGNNATLYGGGIYNEGGTTTVDGSTISANTVSEDGGGIVNNGGTLNVKNGSTISANTADFDGGGIYNEGGTTTVDGSTISGNMALDDGGGIFNLGGTTTVDGSTISANTGGYGGGIFNRLGTTTVTGSRILNNTADFDGGGIFYFEGAAGATTVTGSCIVGNSATSYFNNQPALQIATGNWWGAAAGPNTPGADTTGGNVDVSGHLTAPILGCAPDLQVDKANDTSDNGAVGTPFHWTLTINNKGLFSATFDDSQTILKDELPAGPAYGAPVAGSFVDVTNSANIQCEVTDNTLTCAAAGGDVTLEPLSGSFEVTFPVTPSAPGTLTNPAGICKVDPDGHVTEGDEDNNDCAENTVQVEAPTEYLYLPVVLKKS